MMLPISPSAMVRMEPNRASLIVLVAEDETLIGMAMEEALRQAGYTVAGVFAASSTALEWLENGRADAAVLDFCLRDGECVQLLRELLSREVPIVLHSSFNKLPDEFQELPRILKPGTFDQIVNALDKLLLGEDTASSASTSKSDDRDVDRRP
jgi:DNA-binding response OmpR family regulator